MDNPSPKVSVVVPALNEAASLSALSESIDQTLRAECAYELIIVDDGSTDETWTVIESIVKLNPHVRGVRLRRNFGKAAALATGFQCARGEIVVTMDADLQDDPKDLPAFLHTLGEGADVVVGWKKNRQDPLNRRILTRIFNTVVRVATGVTLRDMNCGYKAMRRTVVQTVPLYGDLFRFLPVLATWEGFRLAEVPVNHHARLHGKSRYGLERVLRGFFDLLSVLFLTQYSKRPMHLFGLVGLLMTTVGVAVGGYLTLLWVQGQKIGDRPLLLLSLLLTIVGMQFFSAGMIGELLLYQNEKRRYTDALPIRDETR